MICFAAADDDDDDADDDDEPVLPELEIEAVESASFDYVDRYSTISSGCSLLKMHSQFLKI